MFKNLFALINALIPSFQSQQDQDDAFLSEAVDIYDLERRMRDIDQRGRYSSERLPLSYGYL